MYKVPYFILIVKFFDHLFLFIFFYVMDKRTVGTYNGKWSSPPHIDIAESEASRN